MLDQLAIYDGLEIEQMQTLVALAGQIKRGKADYVGSVLKIGAALHEAHELLAGDGRDGKFSGWLEQECGIERRTAYNYLNAFNAFGKCETVSHFHPSAMYALAAPNAPIEARQEAIQRSQRGETITKAVAAEIIAQKVFAFANEAPAVQPARNRELSFAGTALESSKLATAPQWDTSPIGRDGSVKPFHTSATRPEPASEWTPSDPGSEFEDEDSPQTLAADAGPTLAPVDPDKLKEWIFRFADKMQILRWWWESCGEDSHVDGMELLGELYQEDWS